MGERKTRQQCLEACLRFITAQPDFPAFSESIHQVMLAVGDEETSLGHLTNVILRDFSVTLKVLRTANSSYYNRSGKPILSVSHAVAMLGVESIRDLAGSLIFFEHFTKQSPGLKELVLLSLLTANHAREVAARVEYPRLEEAYLCGMFKNLGEVLMACYRPREYAETLLVARSGKLTPSAACQARFNFTYDDLAQAMTRHWRMPEKVSLCQGAAAPRLPKNKPGSETELLQAITSFSHSLTAAIHRRDPKGANVSVELLLNDYGPILGVSPKEVRGIADAAIAETKDTFNLLRVPLDDLRLRRQAESALEAIALQPEEVPPQERLFEQLTGEVKTLLDSGADFDLNNLLLMVVEAIHRGGQFDRVLFGFVDAERTSIQGRTGLGENIEKLLESFRFPLSMRGGPVAVALLRKQDLLANDGGDSEIQSIFGARCFGLYPVVVDQLVVGCLYFDRRSAHPSLGSREQALLGELRDCVAVAIRRKRGRG